MIALPSTWLLTGTTAGVVALIALGLARAACGAGLPRALAPSVAVGMVAWLGITAVLARSGWTWLRTIQAGGWRHVETQPVDTPATFALEYRGVWHHVQAGIRGPLVPDERGFTVAYVVIEPASRYNKIMTGSGGMPVLID